MESTPIDEQNAEADSTLVGELAVMMESEVGKQDVVAETATDKLLIHCPPHPLNSATQLSVSHLHPITDPPAPPLTAPPRLPWPSPPMLFLHQSSSPQHSTLITTPPRLTHHHHHHKPSRLLLIPHSFSSVITTTTPTPSTPTTKDSRIKGTIIRWECDVDSLENAEALRR
ncbi:hypothetical protein Droror1_Dr00026477 [Drosera rotundifolia]